MKVILDEGETQYNQDSSIQSIRSSRHYQESETRTRSQVRAAAAAMPKSPSTLAYKSKNVQKAMYLNNLQLLQNEPLSPKFKRRSLNKEIPVSPLAKYLDKSIEPDTVGSMQQQQQETPKQNK